MKKRLIFLAGYLGLWLLFFIVFKGIFLVYHFGQTSTLPASLVLGIFMHGLRLDLSFSAYIAAIPFLLISLSIVTPLRPIRKILKGYTIFTAVLITLLSVIDLELFEEWGFRLDATPLMYLNTPKEMLASAGASPVLLLLILFFAMTGLLIFTYLKGLHPIIAHAPKAPLWTLPIMLFLSAALIIPIRGGLQLAPINVSDAYFSGNDFANQAAINVPWNFFNAISRKTYDKTNPYKYMEEKVAKDMLQEYFDDQHADTISLLKTKRPNVVLIIWESFTAKVVPALGGLEGITPRFNQLLHEGILFDHFYASGDRSDKGIVSILSGYPAQPTQSIIKLAKKSSHLPTLSESFKKAGYGTSFYYGGELEFANIKAYLVNAGFDRIIGKESFAPEDWNSKWGAHDHVVLNKVLEDIKTQAEPFFTTIFTLSSHEPFEVPIKAHIKGEDEESLFLNSLYYADQSIGDFIDQLKQTPWYEETLIIILADHGHRMPRSSKKYEREKFHIPMLWLGGALIPKDSVVNTYSSQTDLAATLLHRLDMSSEAFHWSRDLFNPEFIPFAHFVFNDGFGHISKNGYFAYDNVSKQYIQRDTGTTAFETDFSKAYLQLSYEDYLNK